VPLLSIDLSRCAAPDAGTILDRARALVPEIAARSAQANERRDLHPETISALSRAGLLSLFVPAAFGGLEVEPSIYLDVQNIFAEHCLSTAWVVGVLNAQAFMLAQFESRAMSDVWRTEDALISSSFRPGGRARRVAGGFRVSGTNWRFSSGSSHCQWALIGAMIEPDDAHAAPEMRMFLLPREDYCIIDTWRTFGLCATGSNDIHVDDAFVPEYRTWKPHPGYTPLATHERPGPALYRLPWLFVFTSAVSNLAIGAVRGAADRFGAIQRSPISPPGALFVEDAAVVAVASVRAAADRAEQQVKASFADFLSHAEDGVPMSLETGYRHRLHLTGMVRGLAQELDRLMLLTGGAGVSLDSPLARCWLDLCAARHHPGNNPEAMEQALSAGARQ
jgi:3-hydroxy-9,10-secoandrosta-1,3,5(10)-triene-9,17-dione monooxygenase